MRTEFMQSILIFRYDFLNASFIIGRHTHGIRSLSGGMENFPSNVIFLDSINEIHIVLFNFKLWYQTGKYFVFEIF